MDRGYVSILIPLLVVIYCVPDHSSFSVMFERFEQHNGTNILDFSKIRVRKFNRTVSILDGSLELLSDMDDKFEVSVRLAYSSKGNNQFNEYPMKIAPQKVCHFLNTTWRDYYRFYEQTTNFPEVGACPVTPKVFYFKNHVLDASMLPPYIPRGLWRIGHDFRYAGSGAVAVCIDVYFRVEDEGFF